ncbi:MAG: hypothetical protein GY828_03020 [Candidatus Gracilibacteria bacterium]|nr:hypothetical protein [Candidatus Gracilibacteria bacterium]
MVNSPTLNDYHCNTEIVNATETLKILNNLGIDKNFAQQVALMLDCNTATVEEIVAMEEDIVKSNNDIQLIFKQNRTARNSILKAANDEHYSESADDEYYSEAA